MTRLWRRSDCEHEFHFPCFPSVSDIFGRICLCFGNKNFGVFLSLSISFILSAPSVLFFQKWLGWIRQDKMLKEMLVCLLLFKINLTYSLTYICCLLLLLHSNLSENLGKEARKGWQYPQIWVSDWKIVSLSVGNSSSVYSHGISGSVACVCFFFS